MTDLRVLRKACELMVLKTRYFQEARDKTGDFWAKFNAIEREYADALEVVRIRWGQTIVETRPTSSIFGQRYGR